MKSSEELLQLVRKGQSISPKEQVQLTILLSIPAILAQVSSVVMEYIDAAMVGHLGANESASIGLVTTTIWLLGGLCSAISTGFYVQVAHLIGAGKESEARDVARQAILIASLISLTVAIGSLSISPYLPLWLGAGKDIAHDATLYFAIFSLTIPFFQLYILSSGMLRCSGNIKLPSMIGILMCILDVLFNFLFIFPTRTLAIGGLSLTLPGAGMGVCGAAIGTALATFITAAMLFYSAFFRSPILRLTQDRGTVRLTKKCLKRAFKIGFPVGLERSVMCSAQIMITAIVAPLGAFALAANSFGITAESLCYMPGYGIAEAATTLVGQSIGARRQELTLRFARISLCLGISIMAIMGIVIYYGAATIFGFMTDSIQIITLGTEVLKIEAFAEPMFAASIVSYGIFVGAGDTLIPSCLNFSSIWVIRITLALILVPTLGLKGVWIAMCTELCIRGVLFLLLLRFRNWNKQL